MQPSPQRYPYLKALFAAMLLLLTLGGTVAHAAPAWQAQGLIRTAQGGGTSLDHAVAQVRRETGGRILSAETVEKKGKRVHRIKVLTADNKVRIVRVPAD